MSGVRAHVVLYMNTYSEETPNSAVLSYNNTFGLHCGVRVIDSASRQIYKVSLRSQIPGIGHNCFRAP
jgi:hypothetical protein